MSKILVRKQSGEKEPFDSEKLIGSIVKAGAPEQIALKVADELEQNLSDGISTREIYRQAFRLLRRHMRSVAARYSLKNAILEMGPSGYPFEKFVAEIFRRQGFEVSTGTVVQGRCVQHEIDVVAKTRKITAMAECKFRNDQGKISGVKVPLYIHSRMKDVEAVWQTQPENHGKSFQGWIVTNTRFSSDAEAFGNCSGLHLLSWNFPEKNNLRHLVEKFALFPVTALTGLSKKQKQALLDKNVILVEHLAKNPGLLDDQGLSEKREEVLSEASALCAVGRLLK